MAINVAPWLAFRCEWLQPHCYFEATLAIYFAQTQMFAVWLATSRRALIWQLAMLLPCVILPVRSLVVTVDFETYQILGGGSIFGNLWFFGSLETPVAAAVFTLLVWNLLRWRKWIPARLQQTVSTDETTSTLPWQFSPATFCWWIVGVAVCLMLWNRAKSESCIFESTGMALVHDLPRLLAICGLTTAGVWLVLGQGKFVRRVACFLWAFAFVTCWQRVPGSVDFSVGWLTGGRTLLEYHGLAAGWILVTLGLLRIAAAKTNPEFETANSSQTPAPLG